MNEDRGTGPLGARVMQKKGCGSRAGRLASRRPQEPDPGHAGEGSVPVAGAIDQLSVFEGVRPTRTGDLALESQGMAQYRRTPGTSASTGCSRSGSRPTWSCPGSSRER